MISQTVEDAFNEQTNAEMYSSYLYLSMSAHFAGKGLNGFATWMRMQASEEWIHAMKFFDFILDRGGQPRLRAIDEPAASFGTAAEVFDLVVAHEEKVTGLIHDLVDLTTKERDHASAPFLQWFVAEQVEEEKTATEIRDQLRMIGDEQAMLMMIDRELGTRGAPQPAAAE
jgi:ferritin